jgi:hypothetical protein
MGHLGLGQNQILGQGDLPRLIIARCLVVGVDLMTKPNPGARKSIAVIEIRFEADESLAVGEQREMAATEHR